VTQSKKISMYECLVVHLMELNGPRDLITDCLEGAIQGLRVSFGALMNPDGIKVSNSQSFLVKLNLLNMNKLS